MVESVKYIFSEMNIFASVNDFSTIFIRCASMTQPRSSTRGIVHFFETSFSNGVTLALLHTRIEDTAPDDNSLRK